MGPTHTTQDSHNCILAWCRKTGAVTIGSTLQTKFSTGVAKPNPDKCPPALPKINQTLHTQAGTPPWGAIYLQQITSVRTACTLHAFTQFWSRLTKPVCIALHNSASFLRKRHALSDDTPSYSVPPNSYSNSPLLYHVGLWLWAHPF